MELEKVKLSELKPLENNVRKHSDNQINELIKSVKQFGQTRAIVIDENNNILIGNGLYLALHKMGIEDCQCFRKKGLTEIQKKKLILSDNKVYSLGADDYEQVNNYIKEITLTGDFDIAGFDSFVIENMVLTEEQNQSTMLDYGKVTNNELVETTNEQLKTTTPTTPIATSQADTTPFTNNTTTPITNKSYVICPNCGEIIYLD